MGGCQATSRSLKQVQTPISKVVPSANNLSWLDNSEASTLHDDQLDAKSLSINLSLITFFGRFYRKSINALKSTETFLFDVTQRGLFIEQLASQNNITQATADVWVHAYIDYMIVMAWLSFAVKEKEMYAPFAIQQTQRLHISFAVEYSKFCNILTGDKGLIHYSPNKFVSTNQSIEMMENSYDELKETMNSYVYENPEIFSEVFNDIFKTSTKTKYQLQEIWENFYETFIKNEFSFYIPKARGPEILRAISNICSDNHNFPLTYEGVELLRATLNLSIDYKGDSAMNVFPLLSQSASEQEKSIARSLDEGKLPLNFAKHVSWEQVISVEKARERIVEYKKFILSVLNGEEINELPKEEIKQVWFLHMSFTKNYQKFIQEIIKKNDLQEIAAKQRKSLFEKIEASQHVKTAGSFVEFMQPIMKRQEELVNQKIQSLYSI